jgi:DNA gyrase/topoisomerase IV subunit B
VSVSAYVHSVRQQEGASKEATVKANITDGLKSMCKENNKDKQEGYEENE